MIIDFHNHIFTDELAARAKKTLLENEGGAYKPYFEVTLSALMEQMDRVGIDIAVVQPVATKRTQVEPIIEWLKQIISDRIKAYSPIFPNSDDWKAQIDMISSLGIFKGIKLHPEYQHFCLDEDRMLKLYDYAINKGLDILFHAGFDYLAEGKLNSSPKQFAHVVDELQGGNIIAAHMGGINQWDEVEEYLCGKDIYFDTSTGFRYYTKEQFMKIYKAHRADRILFGSDYPWTDAKYELEQLYSLNISEEDMELMLHKNAERLLGL